MERECAVPAFFSDRTREWFEKDVGKPTPVQIEGWNAIFEGGDVLVCAPTGTGKTLTAFLYWLDMLGRQALRDETLILYVSPLKALGNDIRENLKRPLTALGLDGKVRTGVRNGDTTASERASMLKRPPHILITTPESLYLLLSSEKGRRMLRTVRCAVLDELHAVMDSKRGAHLMLSMERLDDLCGIRVQRIGLSATVEPLSLAADYLSGGRGARIVAPHSEKKLAVSVESPVPDLRILPEKSVWPAIARRTLELTQNERAVLAFADGRQKAEKLAFGVNALAGEGYARTHHGCVSKEQRLEAEQQLREGKLKLMCCTSSMELGIDVGDIDQVLQVGSPGSLSGARQRAGRAGHGPGRVSRLTIFPMTEADCLRSALAARGVTEGRIERACPPVKPLDVVSQHLLSMAAAGEYAPEEALNVLKGAWSFRNLTLAEVEGLLEMLSGEREHQREIPVRPRLLFDRINRIVRGDQYTRMLAYSNIGTIPDRGWYAVTTEDGVRLGELDEEFVYEARLGDRFLLGAFAWRIQEITRDRVIVVKTSPEGAQPPFWRGDAGGRTMEIGLYFGRLLREMNEAAAREKLSDCLSAYPLDSSARESAARFVLRQIASTGSLPDDQTIVLEHFSDEAGEHQLMVHSIFGARVNRALGILLRDAISRKVRGDVQGYEDDDGMLAYVLGGEEIPEGLFVSLDPDTAEARIRALLPAEPMFSMSFRYAAAIAGMMGCRGRSRTPLWIQRLRGAELLSFAAEDAAHPLLAEAARECAEDRLDVAGAAEVLRRVRRGAIRVMEVKTAQPSPMALPLRRQVEAEMMYETAIPSSARELARKNVMAIAPDPTEVEKRYEKERMPESPEQLHTRLLIEGDLLPEELDAPNEWLEELARQGRAAYLEPGLWIASEMEEQYRSGEMRPILRRLLRYRGAQDAGSVAQRYALPLETAKRLLEEMAQAGEAVMWEDGYVHPDVYRAAQRATLSARRRAIVTAPPERFAGWMANQISQPGTPKAQLEAGMSELMGLELPAALWEDCVLPARVSGYRPELLDACLSEGGAGWHIRIRDGQATAMFLSVEDDSLDDWAQDEGELTEAEGRVLRVLERGGAQFDHVISRRLEGLPVSNLLQNLAQRGLVRQDSFSPVRRMLHPTRRPPISRTAGRWERMPLPREKGKDEKIMDLFRACPILCRETCRGIRWAEALEALRRMELTGSVRRGYFVEGLSGAQFVREEDFSRLTAALSEQTQDYVCVNAADPMQMWGKVLPHRPGRSFLCVPGNAVVLRGGMPVCVFERQGSVLTVFEDDPQALTCFARAFCARRVFPGKLRIRVQEYPKGASEALEQAGFVREALEYVLYEP